MTLPTRVFIILMLLSSACSLTSVPPSTSIPVEQPNDLREAVPTGTPSIPDTAIPPTSPPNTALNQPARNTSCTIRSDWPAYMVVKGDTLAGIARRTGSTVSALVAANCLANANVISVGQTLYVPLLPASPVPPPLVYQPCVATVNVPAVNLYAAPGNANAVVSTIAGADQFPVIGQSADWLKLNYPGQSSAWIDRSTVTLAGDCNTIPDIPP